MEEKWDEYPKDYEYNPETGTLIMRYWEQLGKRFLNVPGSLFEGLTKTEDKGKYMEEKIRKAGYKYQVLPEEQ